MAIQHSFVTNSIKQYFRAGIGPIIPSIFCAIRRVLWVLLWNWSQPLLASALLIAGNTSPALAAAEPEAPTIITASEQILVPLLPFTDQEGAIHTLAEHRGKFVILNLWATWCPACIVEMPSLNALRRRLSPNSFAVIALSQDLGGLETVALMLDRHSIQDTGIFVDQHQMYRDRLEIKYFPTTLLIDPNGYEVLRVVGPVDWMSPDILSLIERHSRTGTH